MKLTSAILVSGLICLFTAATWQRITGGIRPGVSHGYDYLGGIGLVLFVIGGAAWLLLEVRHGR